MSFEGLEKANFLLYIFLGRIWEKWDVQMAEDLRFYSSSSEIKAKEKGLNL